MVDPRTNNHFSVTNYVYREENLQKILRFLLNKSLAGHLRVAQKPLWRALIVFDALVY